MKFRLVESSEYISLAKLHLLAFNDFFLTSLGHNFLGTYYQASLKSENTIAVCAENGKEEIIGFCIGSIRSKGFYRKLVLNNFAKFSLQAINLIFTQPKALLRLIINLDKNTNKNDDGNYAELLSIAVSPEFKNLGIGKEMLKAFEQEAIKKGCQKIALTTDFNNNEQVILFYKKMGYTIFYEFTTYPNRKMYKLIKEINKSINPNL